VSSDVDTRVRFQEVLEKYRLNPLEPENDECWSPQLETVPRGRLREIQSEKLTAAVAFLWDHSPLYRRLLEREKLRPSDVRSVDDLPKLPIVTREAFVESQHAFPPWGDYSPISQEIWTRDGWLLFTTGGTTALPRPFRMTRFDRDQASWLFARAFWGMGVRPGDVATFVTNYGAHIFFWEAQQGMHHLGCPVIALGGADLKRRIEFQHMFPATVLGATASFGLFLGERMKAMGLDPRQSGVRILFNGAEPGGCVPATKRRVEDLWGATLHEFFGATETGMTCHSCRFEAAQTSRPMNLHFMEDSCIPEVVDPQTLEPVPEGHTGVLVVSGLYSEGTPFPRYLLGDYTRVTTEQCGCGRTTARAVGGMYGRMDDMLLLRGVHLYPSAIEDVVRRIPEIAEAYEIVVDKRDGHDFVTVRCEPRDELNRADWTRVADAVVREVSSALEVQVEVDLQPYGSLTREFKAKRIRDLRRP
jgi:phenylacetate-CoA ligase